MRILLEILGRGALLACVSLVVAKMPAVRRCISLSTLTAAALVWLVLLPLVTVLAPQIGVITMPERIVIPLRAFANTVAPASLSTPSARESGWTHATGVTAVPRRLLALEEVTALLYVAVALAIILNAATSRRLAARLVRHADSPVPPRVFSMARNAATLLGLERTPHLAFTLDASLPCVVGSLRPVVVIPASAAHWSDERLHAVMLHEMAHVRRRDGIMGVIREVAVAFNWANPLVWMLADRHRHEAELACDAAVIAAGVEPSVYVDELLQLARRLNGSPSLASALGITGASALRERIEGILSGAPPDGWRRVALASMLACCIAAPAALVVPSAEARQVRGLSALNISNGMDASSNGAGLQARWSEHGQHAALFVTGPVDLEDVPGGRVSGSGHVLLVDERNGLHVFEWRSGEAETLPQDVREPMAIGARMLGRLDGRHEARFAGSSLAGLPAWSDDPTAHVVQAGWLTGSERFGLVLRGLWNATGSGVETRSIRAWFVLFSHDAVTHRSRRMEIVSDGSGLTARAFIDGVSVPNDEASMRWARDAFVALQRSAPTDFDWGAP